jgi:two-component system, OmpR family, phosphate regulon response regulator PhoB
MEKKMKKILIVDDQEDIRKLLKLTLEFGDYEIQEASSGIEALKIIEIFYPDIILLDIMMPNMTGIEVCKKIKINQKIKHTQIILLTAKGQQHDIQEGINAGADKYIIKPFSPLELMDTIDSTQILTLDSITT